MTLKRTAEPDMRRKTWEGQTCEKDSSSLHMGWCELIFFSLSDGWNFDQPTSWCRKCMILKWLAHFQHKVTGLSLYAKVCLFPHQYLYQAFKLVVNHTFCFICGWRIVSPSKRRHFEGNRSMPVSQGYGYETRADTVARAAACTACSWPGTTARLTAWRLDLLVFPVKSSRGWWLDHVRTGIIPIALQSVSGIHRPGIEHCENMDQLTGLYTCDREIDR